MKKYFLLSAFIISMITITGCYTVAWNPGDNNFPTRDNALKTGDGLYAQTGYNFYDNSPWWWNIDPSGLNDNINVDNGDQDMGSGTTTIIDYLPIVPYFPPTVGIPVRKPLHTPAPAKLEDNNKNNSQNARPKDNTNNSSTNTRNDNGSRKTDNGRGR